MSVYSTHVAVIVLYTCVVPRVRGNCNREVLRNDMYLKTLDSGAIGRFSGVDDLPISKFLSCVGIFGIGRAFRYLSLACC